MIISVVAAKIWYLKNVRFLLGHPVLICNNLMQEQRGQHICHADLC